MEREARSMGLEPRGGLTLMWNEVEDSGTKWEAVDCCIKDLKAAILEPFINLREKSLFCLGDEAH